MPWRMEYDPASESWVIHPGEHSPNEAVPTEERRMIFIPAVPSSGTSMVAGVLHHLGVNMGNHRSEKWTKARGYEQFEDLDINMYSHAPNGPMDNLVNQRIRLLQYINYRFQTQEGRLGVKTLPTVWMWCPYVERWPIDVLDVRRPLDVSLERDIQRLAERPSRVEQARAFHAWEAMSRHAGVAAMSWARDELLKFHPARLTVDYEEFRADPAAHIERIVEVFELEPNDYQMTAALLSVQR